MGPGWPPASTVATSCAGATPPTSAVPGFGLLDELERRGLDVAADEYFRAQVTSHRTRPRADNVAQIHLATGSYIDRWRAVPDAVEVATYDPRARCPEGRVPSGAGAVRSSGWRTEGLEERIADRRLQPVRHLHRRPLLSAADQADLATLIDIGQPMAVFIAPPPADGDAGAL